MITKTFPGAEPLAAEHRDELGALALRKAADGLHGEMRQSCRTLLTFTRPYLGTASSMSKTFAVSTYSGGSSSRSWMLRRPALRSRLSCARLRPDLVGALERLHALDEGTLRGSRGGLGGRLRRWRHGRRVYSAAAVRQGPGAIFALT